MGGVASASNNKCWICDALYVPKYHQKLGCQANGGACTGRAPLDSPMKTRMPGKWGGARRARPPLDPPMGVHEISQDLRHVSN